MGPTSSNASIGSRWSPGGATAIASPLRSPSPRPQAANADGTPAAPESHTPCWAGREVVQLPPFNSTSTALREGAERAPSERKSVCDALALGSETTWGSRCIDVVAAKQFHVLGRGDPRVDQLRAAGLGGAGQPELAVALATSQCVALARTPAGTSGLDALLKDACEWAPKAAICIGLAPGDQDAVVAKALTKSLKPFAARLGALFYDVPSGTVILQRDGGFQGFVPATVMQAPDAPSRRLKRGRDGVPADPPQPGDAASAAPRRRRRAKVPDQRGAPAGLSVHVQPAASVPMHRSPSHSTPSNILEPTLLESSRAGQALSLRMRTDRIPAPRLPEVATHGEARDAPASVAPGAPVAPAALPSLSPASAASTGQPGTLPALPDLPPR